MACAHTRPPLHRPAPVPVPDDVEAGSSNVEFKLNISTDVAPSATDGWSFRPASNDDGKAAW